jgi:hypothetical protein
MPVSQDSLRRYASGRVAEYANRIDPKGGSVDIPGYPFRAYYLGSQSGANPFALGRALRRGAWGPWL